MGIYLSDAELDVLAECSGLACKVYLRLRRRMDLRTRLAGVMSSLSWQALVEWTETVIPKGGGVMVEKASLASLRRAVEALERRGLVQKRKSATLVFLLPQASTPEIRPKHTRQEPGRQISTEPGRAVRLEELVDTGVFGVEEGEPGRGSEGAKTPYPAHIGDQGVHLREPSSEAGREVDVGDATNGPAPGGLCRDRPAGSQAGSACGRSGDTRGESDRDRPAASHPARGRRLGGGAEAGGASDGAGGAERLESSAENESSRGVSASTGPESVLVEVLRREAIRVPQGSEDLAQWVADAVTRDELEEAIRRAREWRARAESLQPVNVGYLGQILRTMRSEARRAAAAPPSLDVSTEAGLEAMARSLGMWPARPGEDWGPYRQRVLAAARAKGGGHGGVE